MKAQRPRVPGTPRLALIALVAMRQPDCSVNPQQQPIRVPPSRLRIDILNTLLREIARQKTCTVRGSEGALYERLFDLVQGCALFRAAAHAPGREVCIGRAAETLPAMAADTARPIASARSGGTALPICRYR